MAINILVTSLKRLYLKGEIDKEKLDNLLAAGKIDQDGYDYILEGDG